MLPILNWPKHIMKDTQHVYLARQMSGFAKSASSIAWLLTHAHVPVVLCGISLGSLFHVEILSSVRPPPVFVCHHRVLHLANSTTRPMGI